MTRAKVLDLHPTPPAATGYAGLRWEALKVRATHRYAAAGYVPGRNVPAVLIEAKQLAPQIPERDLAEEIARRLNAPDWPEVTP